MAVVMWVVVLLLSLAGPAHAYADPGTGSLIWQMVAAGFVGALFYFRKFWSRLWPRKPHKGEQR